MTPIMQTIIHPTRGDCHRAVIASLLDLEIEQVPHFRLFNENWYEIFIGFLWSCGYSFEGTGHFPKHTPKADHLKYCNIGGYVDAIVPSKNYPIEDKIYHAVVMDLDGLVVHDPHPNKLWEGINAIETGELVGWSLIEKRTESNFEILP